MLDPSGFADEGQSWFESVASKVQHVVAAARTMGDNVISRALDATRGGTQAVQPEGRRDPSGLKSALYDSAKGGWNAGLGVVEGAPNLIAGGAFPGGSDYNAFLSTYRASYDTPAFGATVEVLATVGALRVLGEIGATQKAATLDVNAAKGGVQANKAAGDAFEQQVMGQLQQVQSGVAQQVTVKTQSGVRTRIDLMGRDASGNIVCTECKASATASLTRNQAAAFPEIQQSGAVVVGKGKPGFPGGTQIPPTTVDIVRP
jgi:filamentous hemagglutinin